MGSIPSVSLPAGITCRQDCECRKKCYVKKLERIRKRVREAYQSNYELLINKPEIYWREVEASIMMSRFFRFHVSGDIPNEEYLIHLEYDFSQEKDFSYKGLSMDEIIHHLAVFVSRLWQIHIFGEGNTRTTAVFFIKYLRTLGFSTTNDIFAENAWYFRNALVRANYTNLQKGIYETTEYLEAFLRNLLLNEKNELHNRNLHISGLLNEEKVDIGDTKVDIESVLSEKGSDFSAKTTVHIHRLFEKFDFDEVFGRSAVMELLELKGSGASKLLSNLVQADIIEPVSGHGKGKYKFKK